MRLPALSLRRPAIARSALSYQRRINRVGLLFILPALVHLAYFNIYPLLRSFFLSFHSWSLAGTPQYIGLENYARLLTADIDFARSVGVTLTYSVSVTVLLWFLSLVMALFFDRLFPLRNFFRTVYFVPVVIPWVVTAIVWKLIYNPSYGLFNVFTDALGMGRYAWIDDPRRVIVALIIIAIWKGFGYYMVIFLAGLQGIPGEYYEAAEVDGADRFARIRYITLPLLRPAMLLVAVTALTDSFQVFTPVWLVTQGGPAASSRMLTIYIYENAFVYLKMGYATAIATLMLITLVVVTRVQIRLWQTRT